ncbi:hypothetical protein K0B96_15695 [Horticoccus luteus]|uniref:DUF6680 domain-containing protein n=1 Tax=Horticoccus luteus TaxID=2862869 RepID=A0A8F9TV81_9BACT|nr:DUF6680 family protein [Horticoccus luteus]QYM78725.1 hypothetical protein K0B96_15695 [Horticoccus luteus]
MIAALAIDWTARATDLVMILAVFAGPYLAVRVTEGLRLKKEKRDRQIHVFRTLMATRASSLSPTHVEALNLIDIEFDHRGAEEKRVVSAWKLYHAHLGDHSYPPESWNHRRAELLVDLLHDMAECLGYEFDKGHIKSSSYYPKGYGEIEEDQHQIRKKIRGLIEGKSAIHVISHMSPDQFDRLTSLRKPAEGEQDGTDNEVAAPPRVSPITSAEEL